MTNAVIDDYQHPSTTSLFADADNLTEVLGQLVGAASMCWDDDRVFMSERASWLVDIAVERLIELGWDYPIPSRNSRRFDQHTASAAGDDVAVEDVRRFSKRSQQARLLAVVNLGPLTAMQAALRIMHPSVTPSTFEGCRRRVSNLVAAYYVEDSGLTEINPGGREAIVWEITNAGRAALARLNETGWSK